MGATTDAQPFDLNIQAGTPVLWVLGVCESTTNAGAMLGVTIFTNTRVRNTGHESKGKTDGGELDYLPTPGIRDHDPAFLPEFLEVFSGGARTVSEDIGKLKF